MTTFKTSYKSVATLVDSEGKALRFEAKKAKAFVNPEENVVRHIEIAGELCPMYAQVDKSGKYAVIGVQLRGVLLDGAATELVTMVRAEKAPKPEVETLDPLTMFGEEDSL